VLVDRPVDEQDLRTSPNELAAAHAGKNDDTLRAIKTGIYEAVFERFAA
jgi:hypothetical protein